MRPRRLAARNTPSVPITQRCNSHENAPRARTAGGTPFSILQPRIIQLEAQSRFKLVRDRAAFCEEFTPEVISNPVSSGRGWPGPETSSGMSTGKSARSSKAIGGRRVGPNDQGCYRRSKRGRRRSCGGSMPSTEASFIASSTYCAGLMRRRGGVAPPR
jgi:hypothetical protein